MRAQQRLDLPGLRPLRVVGLVRRQGAHQRAAAPLRAQAGVDLERRIGAGRAEQRRTWSPMLLAHFTATGLVDRPRAARRRTARPRRSRSRARRRRAGPCRSPRSPRERACRVPLSLALITAASAALSTAAHTDDSAGTPRHVEHAEDVGGGDPGQLVAAQRARRGDRAGRVVVARRRRQDAARDVLGLRLEQSRSGRRIREQADRRRAP